MRVHHLSSTEIVVMVIVIVVSLAAMEAVIFIFGARSYKSHEADGKPGEAPGGTHAADHDCASPQRIERLPQGSYSGKQNGRH